MQSKEVCWNITTQCNQNCGYCHRFLDIPDLDYKENEQILKKLIKDGVTDITWTGGEALMYKDLIKLLRISKENNINNKLITNGLILAKSKQSREICQYLDRITLSIDSIDNNVNEELGRGTNHYENIKNVLDFLEGQVVQTTVNTVVSSKNIEYLEDLGAFLKNYNLVEWRIFKFMPLRETAIENKVDFEITDEQFDNVKAKILESRDDFNRIEFRQEKDMESKYVLIIANGDIIQTENGKDIKKGTAFKNNVMNFIDDKANEDKNVPQVVVIGNIAYDEIDFGKVDRNRKNTVEIGGACTFSAIPASMFSRVGMVGKIGKDFDISKFYGYNIDLSAIKRLDMPTTRFLTIWNSKDGQDRTITGNVDSKMEVGPDDIPKKFLGAKYFHLATATPEKQMEIIKYLRKNTDATISVDTIDEFAKQQKCKEVFDSVDIAFVDREYSNLIDCKAPIKIIKYGKEGCLYYSKNKKFAVHANILNDREVVDKTGAGDCLCGAFISLISNGIDEEEALKTAVEIATESIKRRGILNLKLKNSEYERGRE